MRKYQFRHIELPATGTDWYIYVLVVGQDNLPFINAFYFHHWRLRFARAFRSWGKRASSAGQEKQQKQHCHPISLWSNPPVVMLCAKFKAGEQPKRCDDSKRQEKYTSVRVNKEFQQPSELSQNNIYIFSTITTVPSVSLNHCQKAIIPLQP